MAPHPKTRIRLGRFELCPDERLLLHEGRPCRIGGRAFDVLLALIELHHRVVTQDELIEQVWPGLAVEQNNLQVQIWKLRQLLGRRSIVTVPRRGYRYVGPLSHFSGRDALARDRRPERAEVSNGRALTAGLTQRNRLRWHSRPD